MVDYCLYKPFCFAFVPQQGDVPRGKHATMVPLIMPVSVPVHRLPLPGHGAPAHGRAGQAERPPVTSDCKPSVIVARRRSLRNSVTDNFEQVASWRGLKI